MAEHSSDKPSSDELRPEDCLAQVDGDLTVDGLDGPLRIVRDRWGIPHIKAASARDAFFGQGFCMGQDRLFQIELYRRMAHGTSAAMMNKGLLGRDRQNRRLGFGRLAAREWEEQSDEARMILQAYSDGINAAIAAGPKPYEFRVLGHEIEPWSPVDSLAVLKMVSAGAHWATRLRYAATAKALGAEAVNAMIADVASDATLITPSGARWTLDAHPFVDDVEAAMGEPDGIVAAGGGSNCWVIHGSRTDTGAPIVCGDPHLAIGIPAQWYVVHMECPEFTVAGPCNPCYPGPVYYGHNTKIAWTMTHSNGDRWTVYREQIRQGADGPEARWLDGWEPLTRLDEQFEVRNDDTVSATMWETRHGVVVAGDPEQDDEVVAARWGLAEPAHDFDAHMTYFTAETIDQARAGFNRLDSISGNYCFADQAGDIGYQYVGRIPKRPAWVLPVPGWDGEHEWDGNISTDELPTDENPDNGFIFTANNRTTTPDYPHYLTFGATPFRADRLREIFEATEVFSLDEMPQLQGDQTSVPLRTLAERFVSFEAADDDARAMQGLLRGWDGKMTVDSPAALVASETRDLLARATVGRYLDDVPGQGPTSPLDRSMLFTQITKDERGMLGAFESWDAAIEDALARTAPALRERHGDDRSQWRWGDEHQMPWRHNLGRDPELADAVNLPDVPIGGDSSTPFATSTRAGVTGNSGVSFRQILDLSDLNAARICIPPGNSGQPGSPHYADNLDRWRDVDYHPLFVEWEDIEANAEGELRLTPA
ncbi:MAG: penicillin acylase family protein [Dehalococcoidia bacterium]|jgi:penicillin amidase|nr:penicillin acylase family protein [Dehalococcoidia bacterium]